MNVGKGSSSQARPIFPTRDVLLRASENLQSLVCVLNEQLFRSRFEQFIHSSIVSVE
jgi:hypothetical protein